MTWTINGIDPLTTYGLVTARVTGWQDDVAEKYPSTAIPGTPGLVRTATTPVVEPRRLVVSGVVRGQGATAALRVTDARTKLDGLRALLAKSALTLVFADRASQYVTADCEGIVVEAEPAQMIADRIGVTISLVAEDPYFYDTAVTSVILTAVGAACALGTAVVRPTVTITGVVVNPSMSVRSNAGAVLMTMVLTVTTVAGDVLVINHAARTITLNGVARMDLLTAGDFLALDVVTQGDYVASAWPTLSSDNNNCVASYHKAWR